MIKGVIQPVKAFKVTQSSPPLREVESDGESEVSLSSIEANLQPMNNDSDDFPEETCVDGLGLLFQDYGKVVCSPPRLDIINSKSEVLSFASNSVPNKFSSLFEAYGLQV